MHYILVLLLLVAVQANLDCPSRGKVSSCKVVGPTKIHVAPGLSKTFDIQAQCKVSTSSKEWSTNSTGVNMTVAWMYSWHGWLNPSYTIQTCRDVPTGNMASVVSEWCDLEGAYLSYVTEIIVESPAMPSRPIAPQRLAECRLANQSSRCRVRGPFAMNVTMGKPQSFHMALECPFGKGGAWVEELPYASNVYWDASSPGISVETSWEHGEGHPVHTIYTTTTDIENEIGFVETQWCDMEGGYLAYNTSFTVVKAPPADPQTEDGVICKKSKLSACTVTGPDNLVIPPGATFQFKIKLSCPVGSVYTRWFASDVGIGIGPVFGTDLNPVYTVATENRTTAGIGNITTEFCDKDGAYISYVTQFTVSDIIEEEIFDNASFLMAAVEAIFDFTPGMDWWITAVAIAAGFIVTPVMIYDWIRQNRQPRTRLRPVTPMPPQDTPLSPVRPQADGFFPPAPAPASASASAGPSTAGPSTAPPKTQSTTTPVKSTSEINQTMLQSYYSQLYSQYYRNYIPGGIPHQIPSTTQPLLAPQTQDVRNGRKKLNFS